MPTSDSRRDIMLELKVAGMTCSHCEAAVTRAVRSVDPGAAVSVDRASGRVSVGSVADPRAMQAAIEREGYQVTGAGPSGT
jgi:copper chaperone